MKFRNKSPKTILTLTGIAFMASGIDCIENNLLSIGILSIFIGILNFIAIFFSKRHPFNTKIILLVINSIFALLSSYLFFIAGRDKIQYGWLIVFFAYLIATIVAYRKHKNIPKGNNV